MIRLSIVALVLLTGVAAGQQSDPLPASEGAETYLFRSLLRFQGVEPVGRFERGDGSLILVLFGRINRAQEPDSDLAMMSRNVLQSGGAVLIAVDRQTNLTNYFPREKPTILEVSILAGDVRRPTADNCLAANPGMPFLIPKPLPFPQVNLQAMAQCKRVATNLPAYLTGFPQVGFPSVALASLPPHNAAGFTSLPFAVMNDPADSPRGETALVYADAGMFNNQMLAASGTDNLAYAFHLTKFLVDGGQKKRTRCLFIEDGTVRTDFDRVPLSGVRPPVPVPSLEQIEKKLNDVADAAADKIDRNDTLDQWSPRKVQDITRVLTIIVVAATVIAVWRKFWGGKHSPNQSPMPSAGEPTTNILDRRRQEMLRANDVTEPAREYLRERFLAWGLPAGATELPAVETLNEGRSDRAVREAVRKLWEVAAGTGPDRVTFVRWKELEDMIETVDRAAEAGRWRFAAGVSA